MTSFFVTFFFCQNHFGNPDRLKIHIRGCKWLMFYSNTSSDMNSSAIWMPKVILTKILSQKSWSKRTILTLIMSRPLKLLLLPCCLLSIHWHLNSKASRHMHWCLSEKSLEHKRRMTDLSYFQTRLLEKWRSVFWVHTVNKFPIMNIAIF